MTQIRNQSIISMKAASGSVPAYRILTMATGTANMVKVWDTSTCLIIGASATDASATGDAIDVVIGGTCKLLAGAVDISTGSLLTPATDTGKAILATKDCDVSETSNARVFGVALEGISTSAIGEVLIQIMNIAIAKAA